MLFCLPQPRTEKKESGAKYLQCYQNAGATSKTDTVQEITSTFLPSTSKHEFDVCLDNPV